MRYEAAAFHPRRRDRFIDAAPLRMIREPCIYCRFGRETRNGRIMKRIDVRSGPIGPTLVSLSLPVLAGQAFNLLYNIVDTYFIALIDRSDPWLVGSTGLVFPLFFIFLATSFGITGGVSSLVARAIGAGRRSDLDKTAESGMFLALIASAIILGCMYLLAPPLLRLFGGSGKVFEYGLEYLYWLLPTVPFMLLSAVFTGILQGEGRTKHMMLSMMIGTVANIILDPILIFPAGMGIAGAGLATAIANAVGFGYLLVVFIARPSMVEIRWKPSSVSFPVVGEILRVGLPQSVMNFLSSLSFIFYNRMMIGINPLMLTAFTLYSRLEQIALIPIWSLSSALAAISGQAAGAGDLGRMRSSSRIASLMGLGVSGCLFVAYALASRPLFSLFQSDPEVLSLTSTILPWMALSSFVSVPVFMISTIMSSAGFADRSLLLTLARIYALNLPACALGAYVLGGGITTVMASIAASAAMALALALLVQRGFFSGLEAGRSTIRLAPAEAART
jgi:putative MATE family efflux protein